MQKPEPIGEWPTIYEMQMIQLRGAAYGLKPLRVSKEEREYLDFMEKMRDQMSRALGVPASLLRS